MKEREILIKNSFEYKNLMFAGCTIFSLILSLNMAWQSSLFSSVYTFHVDAFILSFISLEIPILLIMKMMETKQPPNSEIKIETQIEADAVNLKYNNYLLELKRGEVFTISCYSGYRSMFSQVVIESSMGQIEFLTIKSYSYVSNTIIEELQKENNLTLVDDMFPTKRKSYKLEDAKVDLNQLEN